MAFETLTAAAAAADMQGEICAQHVHAWPGVQSMEDERHVSCKLLAIAICLVGCCRCSNSSSVAVIRACAANKQHAAMQEVALLLRF